MSVIHLILFNYVSLNGVFDFSDRWKWVSHATYDLDKETNLERITVSGLKSSSRSFLHWKIMSMFPLMWLILRTWFDGLNGK